MTHIWCVRHIWFVRYTYVRLYIMCAHILCVPYTFCARYTYAYLYTTCARILHVRHTWHTSDVCVIHHVFYVCVIPHVCGTPTYYVRTHRMCASYMKNYRSLLQNIKNYMSLLQNIVSMCAHIVCVRDTWHPSDVCVTHYGVASVSRLLKITGLFCKRAL